MERLALAYLEFTHPVAFPKYVLVEALNVESLETVEKYWRPRDVRTSRKLAVLGVAALYALDLGGMDGELILERTGFKRCDVELLSRGFLPWRKEQRPEDAGGQLSALVELVANGDEGLRRAIRVALDDRAEKGIAL